LAPPPTKVAIHAAIDPTKFWVWHLLAVSLFFLTSDARPDGVFCPTVSTTLMRCRRTKAIKSHSPRCQARSKNRQATSWQCRGMRVPHFCAFRFSLWYLDRQPSAEGSPEVASKFSIEATELSDPYTILGLLSHNFSNSLLPIASKVATKTGRWL
jgi:hypothetical protein